eukprot:CAMPEP_0196730604 /NCGR_PEP_ID=MMETSP1091-20130531/10624_1 /TAXON_ID=302021 /ORGANISM="Rhodomonas sp., Strain CCMP768" /LENGTH=79 /DNA_ID=CAMNT_0042073645 /DNA_START=832 /DNA_END=1068 /DNA_ORIENTATION=-
MAPAKMHSSALPVLVVASGLPMSGRMERSSTSCKYARKGIRFPVLSNWNPGTSCVPSTAKCSSQSSLADGKWQSLLKGT